MLLLIPEAEAGESEVSQVYIQSSRSVMLTQLDPVSAHNSNYKIKLKVQKGSVSLGLDTELR